MTDPTPRTLTLSAGGLGLVLALPGEGMPGILAFGPDAAGAAWVAERSTRDSGMDLDVPTATLLPVPGMGSFGWPALAGHRDGRDSVLVFGGWSFDGQVGTGRLTGRDPVAKLLVTFDLSLSDGALAVRTTVTNEGDGIFTLDRCMAGTMLVPEGPAELASFTGMWGREFQLRREPLHARLWLQESRRGRTSHDRFPGVILSTASGGLAAHLGWSGNHLVAVETLDDGRRLVHLGEVFGPGEVRLAAGEAYESPAAYFAPDAAGLRERLGALMARNGGGSTPRPVTLNTWEGIYFRQDLPTLMEQADAAAALGIERFVVDDGWFGRRDSDATSLGDWSIDRRKYPGGLAPLADHVHKLGMEFGLWVEPEMVSPDSDLYRAHPDWVLAIEGQPQPRSRKQLVLDLTRAEVADHVFDALDGVLRSTPIDALKWDMNRDLAPGTDAAGRTRVSAQTRAVYALMDRIRAAHPGLEIESCASGGGRADYGVLARTHRIWTSDCTDPLARLEIQRGARLFFPPDIIGAHVSASPNHQTHRASSLDFRALVALAYHFGVELDPRSLAPAESDALTGWIALHKRLRPVLHDGRSFHLDPLDGRYVWGASDQATLVVIVAQGAQMMGEQPAPLRLPRDIVGEGTWRVASCTPAAPDFIRVSAGQRRLLGGETLVSADTIVAAGLPIPMLRPQSGCVLEWIRVAGEAS